MFSIRKYHKYFAIVFGAFFFTWIVSGIMMMLPDPKPAAVVPKPRPKLDLAAIAAAPADVIRNLRAEAGRPLEIDQIVLRPLRDRPVYEVRARNAPRSLWDPVTGQRVTITQEMAVQIARDSLRDDVGAASVERLEAHSFTYPGGDLPAYRIEFENGRGTIAHVSAVRGTVRFTDARKRTWHFFKSLHEFIPLHQLLGSNRLRRGTLMTVSGLAVVVVITGYYLVFFPRARSQQKR